MHMPFIRLTVHMPIIRLIVRMRFIGLIVHMPFIGPTVRMWFIGDKRDDFDIVKFPFLDGDVPRSTSYGVNISQLFRFARVSSPVDDFNTRKL